MEQAVSGCCFPDCFHCPLPDCENEKPVGADPYSNYDIGLPPKADRVTEAERKERKREYNRWYWLKHGGGRKKQFVHYDDSGQPDVVADNAGELAYALGVSKQTIYNRLHSNDKHYAVIKGKGER